MQTAYAFSMHQSFVGHTTYNTPQSRCSDQTYSPQGDRKDAELEGTNQSAQSQPTCHLVAFYCTIPLFQYTYSTPAHSQRNITGHLSIPRQFSQWWIACIFTGRQSRVAVGRVLRLSAHSFPVIPLEAGCLSLPSPSRDSLTISGCDTCIVCDTCASQDVMRRYTSSVTLAGLTVHVAEFDNFWQ